MPRGYPRHRLVTPRLYVDLADTVPLELGKPQMRVAARPRADIDWPSSERCAAVSGNLPAHGHATDERLIVFRKPDVTVRPDDHARIEHVVRCATEERQCATCRHPAYAIRISGPSRRKPQVAVRAADERCGSWR